MLADPLAPRLDPMAPVPCIVRAIRSELHDTFTLEIEPLGGSLPFNPGQYTMLYVFGIGEVPISISGDPGDSSRIVQTIRRVGAVTTALGRLRPGDPVGVRGPFGTSWPVADAEGGDVLVIAGGIGLAPLRPVIYHLGRHRDRYGSVSVLYGARSPKDLLFADEIHTWATRFDIMVRVTVDVADRTWQGSVGLVTRLIDLATFDAGGTTAFVCGPEIMMRFAGQELVTRGVSADRINVSIERNMKCAVGFCGHCQLTGAFVCRDGPVFPLSAVSDLLTSREV